MNPNKKIEQEDKKDFKPLLYILITIVAVLITNLFLLSFKASAINIMYGGYAGLSPSTTLYGSMGSLRFQASLAGHIRSEVGGNNPYGQATSLNICLNDTIPAGSIFTLNISFAGQSTGTNNRIYPQIALNGNSYDYSVITNSYGEYGLTTAIFYTDVDISGCGLWINPTMFSMTHTDIDIQPINWIRLTDSGLSQSEKDRLFQDLQNISGATSNTSSYAYDILQELKNQQQQAEEQTEEASEEGQTNADGSQTDNEGASQNVIGVIGNVIGAFNTPAGDCSYNVDLGNLKLGDLNFCSGKPPEFAALINLAGSIIIVYACYRVARTIFRIWLTMSVFAQGSGKGKTD